MKSVGPKISVSNPRLAINGGKPVKRKPWQDNVTTGLREQRAATRAIRSGYLSLFEGSYTPDAPFSFGGGPEVARLEKEWSDFYFVEHSVTMNSATSGLFAAIGALGIGYGDEVIVSPFTMTACALAPLIYGAIPVFADVLKESGCLDPASVRAKVSSKTKAILVVHQFGFPARMDEIIAIANEYDLKVIEDCAQAHNLSIGGRFAGTIGDIGVFSLNVNKTIQAGEGGVCVTKDPELAYRLKLIRNHGEAVVGPASYENIVNIAGFNYRMTEITAAVSREQLKRLPKLTKQRLGMVEKFSSMLSEFEFLRPLGVPSSKSPLVKPPLGAYYVLPMLFDETIAGISRQDFGNALSGEGIPVGLGYVKPLYLQPLYQKRSLFKAGYPFSAPVNKDTRQEFAPGTCPVAEELHFVSLVSTEHVRPPNRGNYSAAFRKAVSKLKLPKTMYQGIR